MIMGVWQQGEHRQDQTLFWSQGTGFPLGLPSGKPSKGLPGLQGSSLVKGPPLAWSGKV